MKKGCTSRYKLAQLCVMYFLLLLLQGTVIFEQFWTRKRVMNFQWLTKDFKSMFDILLNSFLSLNQLL